MRFCITDHIDFDAKGRAICPSCATQGKTRSKNLALVPKTDGAYKCHRGCSTDQIREAIGQPKDKIVPTALATPENPSQKITVSPSKVREATEKLLGDPGIRRQWLNDRGITDEMISHYRLGWVRAKIERWYFDAISVPLPINGGTSYYQKKRISPWLPEPPKEVKEWKNWSQYGIPAQVYSTHEPDNPKQTWLCEGEWDAIRLGWLVRHSDHKNDIQICSFSCGAGNVPPQSELDRLLGEVIVFYDLDQAGATGQEKVCKALGDRAKVAIVPYPPEFEQGWDVSNAIDYGFTIDDFVRAADEAKHIEIRNEPPKHNSLKERLVSHDELMARAPDYTDWLVPDLLTSDELFLLAASPRAGKSLMAMNLAHAVATGTPFLGRPVTKGAVIYIRCEDSEAKTKERAIAQGWEEGLQIYWLDRFKLSELPMLAQLCDELDPRLIVWDTLSRIRDGSISESSAEMSQVLEPLQNLCQDKRCTGLLVHHTGKISLDNAGSIDVFDTIRGSSAIRAVCRGVLILAAGDQKYRLAVENGWGKHDLDVLLDVTCQKWKLLGNWVGENIDLTQKDRALDFLNQIGQATIDQIAEATNLPKASLYKVLSRLQKDDMVTKIGHRANAVYARTRIGQIGQSDCLSNPSNSVSESDRASIGQKNILSISDKKVCNEPKSMQTDSDTFLQNDHFLPPHTQEVVRLEGQNQTEQGLHGLDKDLTQSDNRFKSMQTGTCDTLIVGDKVEILTGQFFGRRAFIKAVLDDDRLEVKADSWLISRPYKRSDLRLLKRAGLETDYENPDHSDQYA